MNDPLLGINAPVRLLREQWQSPTALAQELYAMFTAKGPREINDTLTIRVAAGKPALRVIHEEGDTIINEGPTHHFSIAKGSVPTSPAAPGRKPRPTPPSISGRPQSPQPTDESTRGAQGQAAGVDYGDPTRPQRHAGPQSQADSSVSPSPRHRLATTSPAASVPQWQAQAEQAAQWRQSQGQGGVPAVASQFAAIQQSQQTPSQAYAQSVAASVMSTTPTIEFDVPAQFSGPTIFDKPVFASEPVIVNRATGQARTLADIVSESVFQKLRENLPVYLGGATAGTPAYFGVVVSGIGASWLVSLYESGASGALGGSVAVTIPFIGEAEVAPINAVVGPIFRIAGEYIYQPPVWLE